MSSFSQTDQNQTASQLQQDYPLRNQATGYTNPNINQSFNPQGRYPNQYPQSYPQQGLYPPQGSHAPQQSYYPPQQYQGHSNQNPQYLAQNSQNPQKYGQQQQYQNYSPPDYNTRPPEIHPNSPLLRHRLSQINQIIKKNLNQFSPDFQKRFKDNQDFKSLNNKIVFIPSTLIIGHVLFNRNRKWFRLTVNATLIRRSLLGLLFLHLSSNFLYGAAYRDLITRNKDKLQKIVVREQFLSGGKANGV